MTQKTKNYKNAAAFRIALEMRLKRQAEGSNSKNIFH